jgi:hypothetical protein
MPALQTNSNRHTCLGQAPHMRDLLFGEAGFLHQILGKFGVVPGQSLAQILTFTLDYFSNGRSRKHLLL